MEFYKFPSPHLLSLIYSRSQVFTAGRMKLLGALRDIVAQRAAKKWHCDQELWAMLSYTPVMLFHELSIARAFNILASFN